MKKYIFTLIEKEDKFLVLKSKNGKWKLAGGEISNYTTDIDAIKYFIYCSLSIEIEVKDFITKKYLNDNCSIKLFSSRYKSGNIIINDNEFTYKYLTLQEILDLDMESEHKLLVIELYNKILMEINNDAFWLRTLIIFKKDLEDYTQKEFITSFILFLSSIFNAEALIYGFGGVNGKFTKNDFINNRNKYLKMCPTINSDTCSEFIKEMGINFKEYVFDMYLVLADGKLIDCNFRNWGNNKEEKFEFLDGVVSTLRGWIERLMPDISEVTDRLLNEYLEQRRFKMKSIKFVKKSYSTYKIFCKSNLEDSDKVYILYRYGLIKSLLFIDDFFHESLTINLEKKVLFDMKKFIRKARAIVIEMLWDDLKKTHLNVLKEAFDLNNEVIKDKSFFVVNRKCRDNLHYGNCRNISYKENRILDIYQKKYLENVLTIFDKYLHIKFGFFYNLGYGIAKLTYIPDK